jgi:hypothetical protein
LALALAVGIRNRLYDGIFGRLPGEFQPEIEEQFRVPGDLLRGGMYLLRPDLFCSAVNLLGILLPAPEFVF